MRKHHVDVQQDTNIWSNWSPFSRDPRWACSRQCKKHVTYKSKKSSFLVFSWLSKRIQALTCKYSTTKLQSNALFVVLHITYYSVYCQESFARSCARPRSLSASLLKSRQKNLTYSRLSSPASTTAPDEQFRGCRIQTWLSEDSVRDVQVSQPKRYMQYLYSAINRADFQSWCMLYTLTCEGYFLGWTIKSHSPGYEIVPINCSV